MNTEIVSLIVFGFVFGAALFGMWLRQMLPEHHLSSETKDTVKVAMGFVATMTALILGLLVASAKESYDKQASGITQMAAKAIYLDRVFANYGPETKDLREIYRGMVEQVTKRMWPDSNVGTSQPDNNSDKSHLEPTASHSEILLAAIESLTPKTELQTTLKSQAVSLALELGQLRWLEYEEASSAASLPVWCILVFWIAVLFISFGMFAPSNGTVRIALMLASLSVAGAIFLILELRTPFTGLLQIPKTAFTDAIAHLGK